MERSTRTGDGPGGCGMVTRAKPSTAVSKKGATTDTHAVMVLEGRRHVQPERNLTRRRTGVYPRRHDESAHSALHAAWIGDGRLGRAARGSGPTGSVTSGGARARRSPPTSLMPFASNSRSSGTPTARTSPLNGRRSVRTRSNCRPNDCCCGRIGSSSRARSTVLTRAGSTPG
jgi:hypothetical protein